MNLPSFLAGILVGAMALWIFLELIAMAAKRRAPGVTMAGRKRKTPTLDNHGWYVPVGDKTEPVGGVVYTVMGVTGSEE